MDLYDAVKELALSLPDECSDNTCHCPKCGSNKAFSITRDAGQIKFICFRASCGFQGRVDSTTGLAIRGELDCAPSKQVKIFKGELDFITPDEKQWLADKFLISPELLGNIRWGVLDDRVYYPQYTVTGKVQGYIARYYPELAGKPMRGAKAYWKPTSILDAGLLFPNMHVLNDIRHTKMAVLVEDYPSCLRIISQLHLPCCCLGGTNLYDSMIDTLISLDVEHVVVVLDADAISKAIKMKRALSLVFNTTVLPLTGADPKDLSKRELAHLFKTIK